MGMIRLTIFVMAVEEDKFFTCARILREMVRHVETERSKAITAFAETIGKKGGESPFFTFLLFTLFLAAF